MEGGSEFRVKEAIPLPLLSASKMGQPRQQEASVGSQRRCGRADVMSERR